MPAFKGIQGDSQDSMSLPATGGCLYGKQPMRTPMPYRWLWALTCLAGLLQAGAVSATAGLPAAGAGRATGRPGAPGDVSPSITLLATAPVRLVSPAAEAELVGGSQAWLDWEPLAPPPPAGAGPATVRRSAGPAGFEEWEAFLSLDGGGHYTFRVTPHLGSDLHRFAWAVPDVPSADARLLLRFGDERHERAWKVERRFRIVPGADAGVSQLALGAALPVTRALAPGEAPLPGEGGVVSWVEGTRQGAVRRQVAYGPPAVVELDLPAPCRAAALAAVEAAKSSIRPGPQRQQAELTPAPAPLLPGAALQSLTPPIEPLLATRRRNE
jgi:hypothetical protein